MEDGFIHDVYECTSYFFFCTQMFSCTDPLGLRRIVWRLVVRLYTQQSHVFL